MTATAPPTPPPSPTADGGHVVRVATSTLTWGFQIGIAILAIGLVLAAVRGDPLANSVRRPGDVLDAVVAFEANGFVDLAILWMIAVPVIAAAAIASAFQRTGEWRYLTITLLVLAVLAFSIGLAVV